MALDPSSWHRVTITASDRRRFEMEIAYTSGHRLGEWIEAGNQAPDVAIFKTNHPWETADFFFFSPEALALLADLVELNGGVPCELPSLESLTRVLGEEDRDA